MVDGITSKMKLFEVADLAKLIILFMVRIILTWLYILYWEINTEQSLKHEA